MLSRKGCYPKGSAPDPRESELITERWCNDLYYVGSRLEAGWKQVRSILATSGQQNHYRIVHYNTQNN